MRIHAGRLGKQGERLSEEFLNSLLGWVHSGFSVHGEQTVPTDDLKDSQQISRIERMSCCCSERS